MQPRELLFIVDLAAQSVKKVHIGVVEVLLKLYVLLVPKVRQNDILVILIIVAIIGCILLFCAFVR